VSRGRYSLLRGVEGTPHQIEIEIGTGIGIGALV